MPVIAAQFRSLAEQAVREKKSHIGYLEALTHISILNFTYKPLGARFHLCLCGYERDEDALEVETQWVRNKTSHFSSPSTLR
jgi:hypothetical protein